MLIAVFADIHANKPAFEACLSDAEKKGAQRTVLLGDYVGYGGAPEWVLDKVIELNRAGAPAIVGNHDAAVLRDNANMNPSANHVIEWTRRQLSLDQQKFLANLPYTVTEGHIMFVHADASTPDEWRYVLDIEDAVRSMIASRAEVTISGHVHRPALYSMSATAKLTAFTPSTGVPVPLSPRRRWHVVVGSVGQPRDGDPTAAYTLYDDEKREITFCRVAYDIEAAADAIHRSGLPAKFADRLYIGR